MSASPATHVRPNGADAKVVGLAHEGLLPELARADRSGTCPRSNEAPIRRDDQNPLARVRTDPELRCPEYAHTKNVPKRIHAPTYALIRELTRMRAESMRADPCESTQLLATRSHADSNSRRCGERKVVQTVSRERVGYETRRITLADRY